MSELREASEADRSDRRAYHRIRTGVSLHKGEKLRFLTLTFTHTVSVRAAKQKLRHFVRWIRRNWSNFEYFLAHTAEGTGNVLHLAFYGCYLPFEALQKEWIALTGAYRINIQEIKKSGRRVFMGFYLEMTRQKILVRYSYSRGWAWRGFAGDWKEICRSHMVLGKFKKRSALRRWRETIAVKREARNSG